MVEIHNRQRRFPIPERRLRKQASLALELLTRHWPKHLGLLEITFVTPGDSSRIHKDFMDDPAATDVITFKHGELIICPAIAEKQRGEEGLSLEHELLTYVIHGMLHLCGWDDHTEKDFSRMRTMQTRLRNQILETSSF